MSAFHFQNDVLDLDSVSTFGVDHPRKNLASSSVLENLQSLLKQREGELSNTQVTA